MKSRALPRYSAATPAFHPITKMTHHHRKRLSEQDLAFWRAYLEIRSERVPLVDHWRDGSTTWHPRVIQKLLWYSGTPNTFENRNGRRMAHAALRNTL